MVREDRTPRIGGASEEIVAERHGRRGPDSEVDHMTCTYEHDHDLESPGDLHLVWPGVFREFVGASAENLT